MAVFLWVILPRAALKDSLALGYRYVAPLGLSVCGDADNPPGGDIRPEHSLLGACKPNSLRKNAFKNRPTFYIVDSNV